MHQQKQHARQGRAGRWRLRLRRLTTLLVCSAGLTLLSNPVDAWQLPFGGRAHQHQRQLQQLQQLQQQQCRSSSSTPLWAASPATTQPAAPTAATGGGGGPKRGGDDDEKEKEKKARQQVDSPMDAGKLLEVLRGLILRPFEGEWEEWARQEKEVARALKAELQEQQGQGQQQATEMVENEEKGEQEEEATTSEMSMRVLETLRELTPEVRRVLEDAIDQVRAQESEAREKVAAELSELRAQQEQYIAEREEELEVVEGYADQIKELTRAAARKEGEVQQLRRNLKEVQNIRRDLAYRLEQSQKVLDAAVAENREQIEDLQRQLGREQAALKDLQAREAALARERDQARAEAKSLVSAMAKESQGMAMEGAGALEARLRELVDSVGVEEEYEQALNRAMEGFVGQERGVDVWNKWYNEAFGELEGKVAAVGQAADAAVAKMRGEVEGMRRQVEAADERVRAARAEAAGAVREKEQAQKRAAKADLERESVEENARLLQSLYDEETARYEAAMYKMMRKLKEEEGAAGRVQEAGRIERERLQRDYEAQLKAKEGALAAATEGREALERRLDAELLGKAEALAALDAQLQAEQQAREATQARLATFEKRAQELQASVKQLGEERKALATKYEAALSSERNLRAQDQVEWQRRVDRVRTQEMAAVADMQAAQQEAQRVTRELQGAQSSLSVYEQERTSVRAILRLLARVVVDRIRRRRRGRGQQGLEEGQGGLIEGGADAAAAAADAEEAYEKARLYARRTAARASGSGSGGQQGQWTELERLMAKDPPQGEDA